MKRSLLLFVLLSSFLLNPAAFAAPQIARHSATAAAQQTAAAPARPQQAQLRNHILANGLEVIVLEDHSVPLVTLERILDFYPKSQRQAGSCARGFKLSELWCAVKSQRRRHL